MSTPRVSRRVTARETTTPTAEPAGANINTAAPRVTRRAAPVRRPRNTKAATRESAGAERNEASAPRRATPEKTVIPAAGSAGAKLNKDIIDVLLAMAEAYRARGDTFRISAYTQAAAALKRYPKRVASGQEARKLPGIGESIATKIQEILDTGQLQALKALQEESPQALQGESLQKIIEQLERIPGVGPVAARRFVDEMGVRSLADMRRPDIEKYLNKQQRIGLKYLEEIEERIPRAEVAQIEEKVRKEAQEVDRRFHVEAVGSFRRGLPDSGDVDILATHPDYLSVADGKAGADGLLRELVDQLVASGLVTDIISEGPVLFMGICQLRPQLPHRRIDIKLFPLESFPAALLHFTGSWEHNRLLRIAAQEQGMLLNEYGLYELGPSGERQEAIPLASEEDIFRALGVEYAEPGYRTGEKPLVVLTSEENVDEA